MKENFNDGVKLISKLEKVWKLLNRKKEELIKLNKIRWKPLNLVDHFATVLKN